MSCSLDGRMSTNRMVVLNSRRTNQILMGRINFKSAGDLQPLGLQGEIGLIGEVGFVLYDQQI